VEGILIWVEGVAVTKLFKIPISSPLSSIRHKYFMACPFL